VVYADAPVDQPVRQVIRAGLELCEREKTFQARILTVGLKRADAGWQERDKAVEDAGSREVERLSAGLRPLVVIGMIAPLLGLLGTVWGMIEAFRVVATGEGLGDPTKLAGGISQALVTTAAGLAVAIPAIPPPTTSTRAGRLTLVISETAIRAPKRPCVATGRTLRRT